MTSGAIKITKVGVFTRLSNTLIPSQPAKSQEPIKKASPIVICTEVPNLKRTTRETMREMPKTRPRNVSRMPA